MAKRTAMAQGSSRATGTPFGMRLRALRREAGLSQEALAAASGLSVRTISDLERGRRTVPHAESARMLADALSLDAAARDEFFRDIQRSRSARTVTLAAPDRGPATSPAIFGRHAEIAAIEERLASGERLLTLVGPGGVGKTSLARAVADRFSAAGDPVVWVSLEAVTAPDLVLPAIARAADLRTRISESLAAAFARTFGAGAPLLVIDNAEHLLQAAPEIAALLDGSPTLRILVTSREALRVDPERLLLIDPLPLPADEASSAALADNPAVALFMHRLAAAAPDPMVRAASLSDAAAIVRALDGLPLAIELAAAQAATLSLPTIASLLDTAGPTLLARGRRDGPARFQTMDSAIAWSVDLLPPDARRLFRLLAVFRGGFTPDAAVAVAAASGDRGLIAALPALAAAHLIVIDTANPTGRMRLLEPIRRAALDRLRDAGEESAARRAHAAWFLHWAGEQGRLVAGREPLPALDALDADLANILDALDAAADPGGDLTAGLRAAAGLSQYWEIRSRFREGRAALEVLIAAALEDPRARGEWRDDLAQAVFFSGYLAYMQGDAHDLERAINRLRPLAADSPERLALLGILEIVRDELLGIAPAALLPQARETHAFVANGPQETAWLLSLELEANLLAECGDLAGALPLLRTLAGWTSRRRAAIHARTVTNWLGWLLLQLGEHDDARRAFADSLQGSADRRVAPLAWIILGAAVACSGPSASDADLARAARLHGAFDAETDRYGYHTTVAQGRLREESRARIAGLLGQPRFDGLLTEGRDLADDDLVDLVRSQAGAR